MAARVANAVAILLVASAAVRSSDRAEVFIRDVSVFMPQSGTMLPHRDIVVRDTRIASVTPAGQLTVEAKTTINGAGKFAIPGLFDNHAHLARFTTETAALFPAFGVTSIRDMGTDPERIAAWRKGIAYGKFLGPRIVRACGPMLEGRGEQRVDHWVVADVAEAEAVVVRLAALGMECVKVRTYKDADTYRALARSARAHGLQLTGHAPEPLAPADALEAGQRSFEHAFYPYPLSRLAADEKARSLEAFRSAGAAQVPTLVAWRPATQSPDELEASLRAITQGPFSLPPELLVHWRNGLATHVKEKRGSQAWRDAVRTASQDIGEMLRAGVLVLPGSDTGAPFVTPGLSLHEELALLVSSAGMTPAQALVSATLASAKFNGRGEDLGSIDPGKIADIVVLDESPLLRIESTRMIDAVVFRGEALTRAHLNILLSKTRLAAQGAAPPPVAAAK